MKRIFILLSAVVVSLTMTAQMQVWSNGTIIFSHDQSDVDSISFAKPMNVQANMNASSSSSLAGCVYTSSLAGGHYHTGSSGASSASALCALFFLDETSGYYGDNDNGTPYSTIAPFTYDINGNDITMNICDKQIYGKIIGRNGLVFFSFIYFPSNDNCKLSSSPAIFITLNR